MSDEIPETCCKKGCNNSPHGTLILIRFVEYYPCVEHYQECIDLA